MNLIKEEKYKLLIKKYKKVMNNMKFKKMQVKLARLFTVNKNCDFKNLNDNQIKVIKLAKKYIFDDRSSLEYSNNNSARYIVNEGVHIRITSSQVTIINNDNFVYQLFIPQKNIQCIINKFDDRVESTCKIIDDVIELGITTKLTNF